MKWKLLEIRNIGGKKISELAGMRTNDLEDLLESKGISNKLTEIQGFINDYVGKKTALTTIKSKTFKSKGFTYDDDTSRIIKMEFTEN